MPAEISKESPDLLEYCGSDGARWAEQFRVTAIRLGYSDMDEGWLIGWFANAIERAIQVRHPQTLAASASSPEPETPPAHVINELCDAVTNGIQWLRNVRDDASSPQDGIDEMEANWTRIKGLLSASRHSDGERR